MSWWHQGRKFSKLHNECLHACWGLADWLSSHNHLVTSHQLWGFPFCIVGEDCDVMVFTPTQNHPTDLSLCSGQSRFDLHFYSCWNRRTFPSDSRWSNHPASCDVQVPKPQRGWYFAWNFEDPNQSAHVLPIWLHLLKKEFELSTAECWNIKFITAISTSEMTFSVETMQFNWSFQQSLLEFCFNVQQIRNKELFERLGVTLRRKHAGLNSSKFTMEARSRTKDAWKPKVSKSMRFSQWKCLPSHELRTPWWPQFTARSKPPFNQNRTPAGEVTMFRKYIERISKEHNNKLPSINSLKTWWHDTDTWNLDLSWPGTRKENLQILIYRLK